MIISADMIRQAIVDQGLGTLPASAGAWPVHVSHMAEAPDSSIGVYGTAASLDGRLQHSGEHITHPGWQVRVRALDYTTARDKMAAVYDYLETINRLVLTVSANRYLLEAVNYTSGVIPIGQSPNDDLRRENFTLNGTLSARPM